MLWTQASAPHQCDSDLEPSSVYQEEVELEACLFLREKERGEGACVRLPFLRCSVCPHTRVSAPSHCLHLLSLSLLVIAQ